MSAGRRLIRLLIRALTVFLEELGGAEKSTEATSIAVTHEIIDDVTGEVTEARVMVRVHYGKSYRARINPRVVREGVSKPSKLDTSEPITWQCDNPDVEVVVAEDKLSAVVRRINPDYFGHWQVNGSGDADLDPGETDRRILTWTVDGEFLPEEATEIAVDGEVIDDPAPTPEPLPTP